MGQQPVIQTSFNSGEWAPSLYGRVDLTKYHSGAALLRNFFVDYRGGATTRPGSRYVLQARAPGGQNVRLIPFQAALNVTYILEFGQNYIRFYNNGAPVLESAKSITAAVAGPPEVFTLTAHGYANNDWLFIANNFYIVQNATANTFTLTDLQANAINTNPFTLPVNAQRIFTLLNSPYLSGDLFGIKYAQNVAQLILCHPNYPPSILTLNTTLPQPSWTLTQINIGATINTPSIAGAAVNAPSGGTSATVSYQVTAVDQFGQESAPSSPVAVTGNIFGVTYTINLLITQVANAKSYNMYKTVLSVAGAGIPPPGSQFGFIGNFTGTNFFDTSIAPDFAQGPPVVNNPFFGASVGTLTLTAPGTNFGVVPTVQFSGGSPTSSAIASCSLFSSIVILSTAGSGYVVNQVINAADGLQLLVTSVNGIGAILGFTVLNPAVLAFGSVPSNPVTLTGSSTGINGAVNLTWSVTNLILTYGGSGYLSAPSVAFINGGGGGGASATAVLGGVAGGNPTVPALVQQRLFLGGQAQAPSQFALSQPGAYFNFNTTFPVAADNAITASLNGVTLNSIKSAVAVSAGLIIFSDHGAWLLNGGSPGSAISALQLVANPQAFSGASDLPPIVTPNDIIYVQAKQSIVRDLAFNFYLNNYVGSDISILSSHLFYTFLMRDWCWAEEPFKVAWLVRSDGALLSLTFVKEQELIAWAQHNTQGLYQSTASVPESTGTAGIVDAVYTVVQRTINGVTRNYIERNVELTFPNDYKSSWQVDAGIGYNGSPATTFSGAQHLGGMVVTGLADGVVINFTMPTSGTFVFGPGGTTGLTNIANASIVTVGLSFLPQLTTLPLDLGEPTVQGKRKKITGVTLKVVNTLGLSMGRTVPNAVPLQDLVLNNMGTMTNLPVTGLVTGDVRGILDPLWDVPGQYTIQQLNPFPASILAVVPEIGVGDTQK